MFCRQPVARTAQAPAPSCTERAPSDALGNAGRIEQLGPWTTLGDAADQASALCLPEPLREASQSTEEAGPSTDDLLQSAGTSDLLARLAPLWSSPSRQESTRETAPEPPEFVAHLEADIDGLLAELQSVPETGESEAVQNTPATAAFKADPRRREAVEKGRAVEAKYEGLLAQHRAALAERAASADPAAQEAQETLDRLDAAHQRYAEVDLGNGVTVPVPYMVNYKTGIWPGRKTSDARRIGNTALKGAGVASSDTRSMGLGKGSADANQAVLRGLLTTRPWEKLSGDAARTFARKLAAVLPEGASDTEKAGYQVLVYSQLAGYGTDCAGYVQYMLMETGAVRDTKVRTGVGGLTKSMGEAVEGAVARGSGKGSVARPVNDNGAVVVRPGDMMRMSGGGHIGMVRDVVDRGDEVLLRVAHSTPDQRVYGAHGQMGTRPEGLRDDLIVWSRSRQRWTAVRSHRSSAQLNTPGTISGFFRTSDAKVEKALKFWEK
jgi:hypothetical protein